MNSIEPLDSSSLALQVTGNIELYPVILENDSELRTSTKVPLSRISALGTAFDPISQAITKAMGGTTTGIYKVTIPNGTHLADYKSGVGNLGTVLNADNKITGQAVLNPVAFNPTMIFMATALASIDKKLDKIQELQQEMMSFLVKKERAELRGNLILLSDILNNYKYNWNNELYKSSNHVKVLDIKQSAEQKILFYRDLIESELKKKRIVHTDMETKKQIDRIQKDFQEYQLALYIPAFSSFLDVMLLGNFTTDYLKRVREKIEGYSYKYKELYTKSYDQLEEYHKSTIESTFLKGLRDVSKSAGEVLSKVPILSMGPVDEALVDAGNMLDDFSQDRKKKRMGVLVGKSRSSVRLFLDNIEMVDRFYNNPMVVAFDKENVYLGITESSHENKLYSSR